MIIRSNPEGIKMQKCLFYFCIKANFNDAIIKQLSDNLIEKGIKLNAGKATVARIRFAVEKYVKYQDKKSVKKILKEAKKAEAQDFSNAYINDNFDEFCKSRFTSRYIGAEKAKLANDSNFKEIYLKNKSVKLALLIDYLQYGIELANGEIRPFDIIDYYNLFEFNPTELKEFNVTLPIEQRRILAPLINKLKAKKTARIDELESTKQNINGINTESTKNSEALSLLNSLNIPNSNLAFQDAIKRICNPSLNAPIIGPASQMQKDEESFKLIKSDENI